MPGDPSSTVNRICKSHRFDQAVNGEDFLAPKTSQIAGNHQIVNTTLQKALTDPSAASEQIFEVRGSEPGQACLGLLQPGGLFRLPNGVYDGTTPGSACAESSQCRRRKRGASGPLSSRVRGSRQPARPYHVRGCQRGVLLRTIQHAGAGLKQGPLLGGELNLSRRRALKAPLTRALRGSSCRRALSAAMVQFF